MTPYSQSPQNVTAEAFGDPAVRALVNSLCRTGPLIEESVSIPGSERRMAVIRPQDIDGLLDQSADDPEQNLPYWAEIWPSGIALAGALLREPELVAGQPVLELGSGLGITAAVALHLGAQLVATDYAPESIALTKLTCRIHTGQEPETRQVNWRSPDTDLLQEDGSRWPVVLAADVLYEERDIDPVLDVLERILAPGGLVWLAEPGRRPSQLALQRATGRGWSVASSTWEGEWPDPKDAGVIVRVHQMRRE
ncbi:MAG TPA: methyltransferase [Thermomicrobiales bacterium]|nr:methyltransferase [Thermomicrobiales bacterium]